MMEMDDNTEILHHVMAEAETMYSGERHRHL